MPNTSFRELIRPRLTRALLFFIAVGVICAILNFISDYRRRDLSGVFANLSYIIALPLYFWMQLLRDKLFIETKAAYEASFKAMGDLVDGVLNLEKIAQRVSAERPADTDLPS